MIRQPRILKKFASSLPILRLPFQHRAQEGQKLHFAVAAETIQAILERIRREWWIILPSACYSLVSPATRREQGGSELNSLTLFIKDSPSMGTLNLHFHRRMALQADHLTDVYSIIVIAFFIMAVEEMRNLYYLPSLRMSATLRSRRGIETYHTCRIPDVYLVIPR